MLGEFARTPRYQGGGSSQITPTRLDDALDRDHRGDDGDRSASRPATRIGDSDEAGQDLLDEAAALAGGSDVALVFVGSEHETEGADRTGIDLPAAHLAADRAGGGRQPAHRRDPVQRRRARHRRPGTPAVPALIEGWLLGQAGGGAIADVLFGRVNPSGRLAETIPLKLADHPSYLDFPGEHGHVRYGEGLYVGYRGFDAREQEVAYPFGFGLSYTTFGYGEASAAVSGEHGHRGAGPRHQHRRAGRP